MILTFYETFKEIKRERILKRYTKNAEKSQLRKLQNRQRLIELYPKKFKYFEHEINVIEAIKYSKDWLPHRKWLKKNNINFSRFEEER